MAQNLVPLFGIVTLLIGVALKALDESSLKYGEGVLTHPDSLISPLVEGLASKAKAVRERGVKKKNQFLCCSLISTTPKEPYQRLGSSSSSRGGSVLVVVSLPFFPHGPLNLPLSKPTFDCLRSWQPFGVDVELLSLRLKSGCLTSFFSGDWLDLFWDPAGLTFLYFFLGLIWLFFWLVFPTKNDEETKECFFLFY